MANQNKEKDIKAETLKENKNQAAAEQETTELAKKDKKSIRERIKELSTPMKVGLGLLGGAVITGAVFVVKAIVDALAGGDSDSDDSDEPIEAEGTVGISDDETTSEEE